MGEIYERIKKAFASNENLVNFKHSLFKDAISLADMAFQWTVANEVASELLDYDPPIFWAPLNRAYADVAYQAIRLISEHGDAKMRQLLDVQNGWAEWFEAAEHQGIAAPGLVASYHIEEAKKRLAEGEENGPNVRG